MTNYDIHQTIASLDLLVERLPSAGALYRHTLEVYARERGGPFVEQPGDDNENDNNVRLTEPTEESHRDATVATEDATYIDDVFRNLKAQEPVPKENFLFVQATVRANHRAMVIEWLHAISMKCLLKVECIFLAVSMLDRFLQKRTVPVSRLQLVGATMLLIASKFEETYFLPPKDLAGLSDGDFSQKLLVHMERLVLHALEWQLCTPTTLTFLRRYSRLANLDVRQHTLAKYIAEIGLADYSVAMHRPSLQAASSVYLARRMDQQQPFWPHDLEIYTGYSEEALLRCTRSMNRALKAANAASPDECSVVVLKYKAAHCYRVSTIPTVDI